MGESPYPDWMNQWQALSRQYLGAWQEAAQAGTGAVPPAAPPPWQGSFEQWSRLAGVGTAQSETVDRLLDSAKSYAAFMQSMLGAAPTQAGAMPWAELLKQGFAGPMPGANPFAGTSAMPSWQGVQQGFAPWMNALSSMRTPPKFDTAEMKAWMDLPAFGLLREYQEHHQKTALAWVDYQEQTGKYNALMLKAAKRGFELFEGKLTEREQPGRQIESLRALYDLWVDAAEEGYAEIALSSEFREVYGALVNAQMRVRSQIQKEVERVATDLGMPTRSEINSIGERLQVLRREVRERRAPMADDLADEVAALRAEFAAFKADMKTVRPTPAAATPKSKSKAAPRGPEAAVAAPKPVHARREAKVALRKAASKKAPRAKPPERAVAAVAAGNFASRIAKFANASLGTKRAESRRSENSERRGNSKKKR